MKLKLFLTLALLTAIPASSYFTDCTTVSAAKKRTSRRSSSQSSSKYIKYTGTIGKYKVTAFLDNDGNGYYYYGNGSKGKLTLRGREYHNDGRFGQYYLYEYDKAGNQTAVWDVQIGPMWVDMGKYYWNVSGTMTTNGRTYEVNLWQ